MLTLTFGYKLPEDGDKGSVFFPALAFDIQRLNDHDHDGSNSTKLTAQSVGALIDSTSIVAAAWVAVAGQPGTFKQTVIMPPNTDFDSYGLYFQVKNGVNIGQIISPSIVKVAAATYDIFTNDNSLNLRVLYLV